MIILGCGYIGRRVARHYLAEGRQVKAVVRSTERGAALIAEGIPAIVCDLAACLPRAFELQNARVFHFVPPPARGVEDGLTRRLVEAFDRLGHPRRLVYISTTGVYGDCGGEWVDESRSPAPMADRARRRFDAECILGEWSRRSGCELVVLRVAGIYGPGRLPLERIRRGLPLVREEEAPYSNRVHADDVVAACIAAMDNRAAVGVYNVTDGHPSTMTDYFFRVADAAGLPRPPVLSLEAAEESLSQGMMSYMHESRRLSNRRLCEELGVKLRYPNLSQGLENALSVTQA